MAIISSDRFESKVPQTQTAIPSAIPTKPAVSGNTMAANGDATHANGFVYSNGAIYPNGHANLNGKASDSEPSSSAMHAETDMLFSGFVHSQEELARYR